MLSFGDALCKWLHMKKLGLHYVWINLKDNDIKVHVNICLIYVYYLVLGGGGEIAGSERDGVLPVLARTQRLSQ